MIIGRHGKLFFCDGGNSDEFDMVITGLLMQLACSSQGMLRTCHILLIPAIDAVRICAQPHARGMRHNKRLEKRKRSFK